MAVITITAPPGKGKTLNLTRLAINDFKRKNNIFNRIKKNYIYKVNQYSNYPILLYYKKTPFKIDRDNGIIENSIPLNYTFVREINSVVLMPCDSKNAKYYGVFSNQIKFTDMRIEWTFTPNSSFFIDELQYIYDSQEYRDFPDCIAHFFQVHRHLLLHDIYTNSQSISRIIKRVKCVSEEFWNIIDFKTYKFLPFLSKTTFKITYDAESTTENENSIKEDINADYVTCRFFNSRVFNGYCTRYLAMLNHGLPKYKNVGFDSLLMPKNSILESFNVSNEEKERLKNLEF